MAAESIEQLTKRYKELERQKITADANLANATKELLRVQEEARQQWNTDDVEALEKMLNEMRAANEKQLAEYQAHLESVEKKVAAVEAEFRKTS